MHLRRFIAALMILLGLSAQAPTAFACAMMPDAALVQCCCAAEAPDQCPQGTATHGCCEIVASADAPMAHAAGPASMAHPADALSWDTAPAAVESQFRPAMLARNAPLLLRVERDPQRHVLRPRYLMTARLRL